MDINVAAAARRLGMSEPSVRTMIAAGRIPRQNASGPALVAAADVDHVRVQRRNEALRRHPDLAAFAQEIRQVLWPIETAGDDSVELIDGRVEQRYTVPWTANGPASGVRAMRYLPADASAIFGPDVIEVAAAPSKAFSGVCRFCFADAAARIRETLRPENSPAYGVLLGTQCAGCRARFAAEATAARAQLTALRARVDRQTTAQRKERARAEYEAAKRGASSSSLRLRAAADALVRSDPSAAVTSAVTASGASRLNCACTSETLCADHAQRFASKARRGRR